MGHNVTSNNIENSDKAHTEVSEWATRLTFDQIQANASSRILIPGRHYEPETIWFNSTSYFCIYKDNAQMVMDGDHFVSQVHSNWTLHDW